MKCFFFNSNLNWNNIQQHETKQCKIPVDEICKSYGENHPCCRFS